MATHDYVIANQTGANTRSDLNNLFSAIVSQNSSGSEPATKYAYMVWADTGNDLLKVRNASNNAWISLYTLSTGAPVTASASALPKAGGTMTGDLILGDNVKLEVGSATGGDLQIYHDGSHSYIEDTGTGNLKVRTNKFYIDNADSSKDMAIFTDGGSAELYHNNIKKIETTANGVTVTGGAVGTMTTDNDGSFSMSASNNFKCTPTGNFTLTFTNIVAQSGNILLVNSGGHTVSAHANTKVDANLLATVSTAGTYLLSYFADGTNVYMTNSAVYT